MSCLSFLTLASATSDGRKVKTPKKSRQETVKSRGYPPCYRDAYSALLDKVQKHDKWFFVDAMILKSSVDGTTRPGQNQQKHPTDSQPKTSKWAAERVAVTN